MTEYTFICPCLFGIEGILSDEIRKLGLRTQSENGRVRFFGTYEDAARVSLWSRCAERVLLMIDEFDAVSFDELFEKVKCQLWEDYLPKDAMFPVKGYCLNSQLHSVSDCQAIIKKAVVERMKAVYKTDWFNENGNLHQISFSIMKDRVTLMLDMTGEALHKRGYRARSNLAPLRETLAAAMVILSRPRKDIPIVDPMCGSGTIAIEAALYLSHTAPGLYRTFAAASWDAFDKTVWARLKEEAKDMISPDGVVVRAFDIDKDCVELCRQNARLAGMENCVKVKQADVRQLHTSMANGTIITNPPYGERLLNKSQVSELYKDMGKVFFALPGWRYFIISSDEDFEKSFGRKADKKRKLYNGMLKCDLYQYLTPRIRQDV